MALNDIVITRSEAEAIVRFLGAAITFGDLGVADDDLACTIQDRLADRLEGVPVRTVGFEQSDGSVVNFEV